MSRSDLRYMRRMAWTLDARIPVLFVAEPLRIPEGPPAALLCLAPPPPLPEEAVAGASFEGGVAIPHLSGCACCQGRSEAAQALDRLFQARARGACPWFARVVVGAAAAAEVRRALAEDALSAARFRAW